MVITPLTISLIRASTPTYNYLTAPNAWAIYHKFHLKKVLREQGQTTNKIKWQRQAFRLAFQPYQAFRPNQHRPQENLL
jgi:hypothetical protein